jgi:RNA polymerase sigma-70 factor (ECF subfamily)
MQLLRECGFLDVREAAAMVEPDSCGDVMARLRAGDQSAAREIFQRFVDKLVRLARRQFNAALRRKVDPEDVVQSAYKSFFLRHRAGKVELQDWGNLWGLLTVITLRKCLDRVEYYRTERRDVQREAAAQPGQEGTEPWWQAVAREPRPEEAAVLAETVEHLLRSLEPDDRPVLEMSLQGYTTQEICRLLGRKERSVRRLREGVGKELQRRQLSGD